MGRQVGAQGIGRRPAEVFGQEDGDEKQRFWASTAAKNSPAMTVRRFGEPPPAGRRIDKAASNCGAQLQADARQQQKGQQRHRPRNGSLVVPHHANRLGWNRLIHIQAFKPQITQTTPIEVIANDARDYSVVVVC